MRVAIVGCCHGELNDAYAAALTEPEVPDLIIMCGDFEALRDEGDLDSMAAPLKYRVMGDFSKYYENGVSVLTLVVGGNHEASRHMMELPYGGWLAPNIYYLGYAGVVRFKGLRIGGLSGIWYHDDFWKPHHETLPLNEPELHSVYHIRQEDVQRLWLLGPSHLDVMISHDWPAGIEHHGNIGRLLRQKKHLTESVDRGTLGSPPGMQLLRRLQPLFWLAAHLHVHYEATYEHGRNTGNATRFIALDKVLPRRKFIKFLKLEPVSGHEKDGFTLDPEWLGVLRATQDQPAHPNTAFVPLRPFAVPEFGTEQTKEFLNRLSTAAPLDPTLSSC